MYKELILRETGLIVFQTWCWLAVMSSGNVFRSTFRGQQTSALSHQCHILSLMSNPCTVTWNRFSAFSQSLSIMHLSPHTVLLTQCNSTAVTLCLNSQLTVTLYPASTRVKLALGVSRWIKCVPFT